MDKWSKNNDKGDIDMIPTLVPIIEGEDFAAWIQYIAELNEIKLNDLLKYFLCSYYKSKFFFPLLQ